MDRRPCGQSLIEIGFYWPRYIFGDFIKIMNVINIDEVALRKLGQAASIMARAEGFDAHARAVERRLR